MSKDAKIIVWILIIVFVIIPLIVGVAIYIKASKAQALNPTTKVRPTPQSSWTEFDWLKNGYTQSEIDAAKKINGFMPKFSF